MTILKPASENPQSWAPVPHDGMTINWRGALPFLLETFKNCDNPEGRKDAHAWLDRMAAAADYGALMKAQQAERWLDEHEGDVEDVSKPQQAAADFVDEQILRALRSKEAVAAQHPNATVRKPTPEQVAADLVDEQVSRAARADKAEADFIERHTTQRKPDTTGLPFTKRPSK